MVIIFLRISLRCCGDRIVDDDTSSELELLLDILSYPVLLKNYTLLLCIYYRNNMNNMLPELCSIYINNDYNNNKVLLSTTILTLTINI